jgi:hypothetical protein
MIINVAFCVPEPTSLFLYLRMLAVRRWVWAALRCGRVRRAHLLQRIYPRG